MTWSLPGTSCKALHSPLHYNIEARDLHCVLTKLELANVEDLVAKPSPWGHKGRLWPSLLLAKDEAVEPTFEKLLLIILSWIQTSLLSMILVMPSVMKQSCLVHHFFWLVFTPMMVIKMPDPDT